MKNNRQEMHKSARLNVRNNRLMKRQRNKQSKSGVRSNRLAADVTRGLPLADSLAARGLLTSSLFGLIAAAERARNLPWALRELGDALVRRSARLSYRLTMVLFPLAIFACASLVALFALAMFTPLTGLMKGLYGS